jgi:hypothetical protein
MVEYLQIRNWKKFQHYKDRNPPWVKWHYEVLASEDWVMLADASKLLMPVCMLIGSRNEGRVPNNPTYIKRVAYLDKLPDLTPLISCGFLSEVLADASVTQANDSALQADARPETETYRTETETEKKEVVALSATTDPIRLAVSDWNLLADRLNLPKVERLSPGRKQKWLANYGNGSAGRWSRVLAAIEESEFCQGENDRGWKAGFDFVVTASKIDRLLEGFYRSDPNAGKSKLFKVAEKLANEYENEEVGISDQTSDNSAKALWERNRDSSLSGDISGRVGAVLGNPTERGDSEGAEGLEMVPDSHGVAGGSKGNEEDQK